MTTLCANEWISADPATVFQALRDPARAEHWMAGLTSMVVEPAGLLETDSKFRETRKMFGREHTVEFEVVRVAPGECIELAAIDCGVSYHFVQSVRPEDGGTRLTIDGTIEGGGMVARMMLKLMGAGMMRKALAKDLAALKAYLERTT